MRRHLANVHSLTSPTGIIYKMTFSVIWRDRSALTSKAIVHWIGINL